MNTPTFGMGHAGLTVEELDWESLTNCERAVFGIPQILPIEGLTHSADPGHYEAGVRHG